MAGPEYFVGFAFVSVAVFSIMVRSGLPRRSL